MQPEIGRATISGSIAWSFQAMSDQELAVQAISEAQRIRAQLLDHDIAAEEERARVFNP
jgi:hypothetical protein